MACVVVDECERSLELVEGVKPVGQLLPAAYVVFGFLGGGSHLKEKSQPPARLAPNTSIPRKNAKALALDTPIPTPNGWTTMGDLQIGDVVFNEDGAQCKILQVSPIFIGNKCYEVEFSDGEIPLASRPR